MFIAGATGTVFGFVSAIPIAGPISALVFSEGMKRRYSQGRWVALGAGLSESAYAFAAFWGFNHLLARLGTLFLASHLVAALILGALGIYFLLSKQMVHPAAHECEPDTRPWKAFLLGAGICAINPSLIATWTATITTLYSLRLFPFTNANGAWFSAGICIGIFAWFSLLLALIARYRDRLHEMVFEKVLRAIGVLLLVLSAYMLVRFFMQLGTDPTVTPPR